MNLISVHLSHFLIFWFLYALQIFALVVNIIFLPKRFECMLSKGFLFYWVEESIWIFLIQQASFIILSVYLIRIPSMCLAILFREVPFKMSASIVEMVDLETKWKRQYFMICDVVADINSFIGQPLLLFVAYVFLTFVSHSYLILNALIYPDENPFYIYYDLVFVIIQNIICITFLIFVSEEIPKQVRSESKTTVFAVLLILYFY